MRDELRIDRERLVAILRFELDVLVDVALHQTHRDRIAVRDAPFDAAHAKPRNPNGKQSCCRHGGAPVRRAECFGDVRHQCRRSRGRETDQEYAAQGRVTRERRLRLRVTHGQPRHTHREPGAQPFRQSPKRRGRGKAFRRINTRQMRRRPACEGGKKREVGAKERRRECGKHARHAAEHRQGDVEPGHAAAEQPEPECKPEPRGGARRRGSPPQGEQE